MDIMSMSKLRYKYFFSQLAAWDWNHEVPILIDEEGNEVVVDENTLIAKQENLDIYTLNLYLPCQDKGHIFLYLPRWGKGQLFFDHWTGNERVDKDEQGFALKVKPLAVISRLVGYEAAVRLESNKEIVIRASNKNPLILLPGSYVCLHPFV